MTGKTVTVQPFLVGPAQNASFKDSTDHSHKGLAAKLDVQRRRRRKWTSSPRSSGAATRAPAATKGEKQGTQFARLVMAHIDCDTIPFFWRYASRFTHLRQHFRHRGHALDPERDRDDRRPVRRNAMGQASEQPPPTDRDRTSPASSAARSTARPIPASATTEGPPLVNDPQPWWGSEFDRSATAVREPTAPDENWDPDNIASNLTFASLPLTMMGGWINWFTDQDRNPAFDLADVKKDIPFIAGLGGEPVQWRWYQNGYDLEPTDAGGVASHIGYVSHHNGPQYFGYISNNPAEQANLRGEGDFFADIAKGALPTTGGVFYIRGGYYNLNYPRQTAVIQNPQLPEPERTDPGRARQDHPQQVRRRRPSELFRQPAHRGHGRARRSTRSPPTRTSGRRARSSSPTTSPTGSTITFRRGS